jgi:hypothetical protein
MSESDQTHFPPLLDHGALGFLGLTTTTSTASTPAAATHVHSPAAAAASSRQGNTAAGRARASRTTAMTSSSPGGGGGGGGNGGSSAGSAQHIPGPAPGIDKNSNSRHQHHHHHQQLQQQQQEQQQQPYPQQQRRAGKYTHPFGGMRRFAEDRARHSGWDVTCLNFETSDIRRTERSIISDSISEKYKEAFIGINIEQGKGRPKANNISAAKKTVKMIAERVLLALEARATQLMFSEIAALRTTTEAELAKLRQIDACGKENPLLTYDEIRTIIREKLNSQECHSDEFLPGEKLVRPETAVIPDAISQPEPVMAELVDDEDASREALKQALVEMRADDISKGVQPTLISGKWVEQLTAAALDLVRENYSKQYAPAVDGTPSVTGANTPDAHPVLGCPHFRRKNRVLMACCGTFPVCRMCHFQDQSRIHDIRIEPVETVLCVPCGNVQPKAQSCTRCKVKFGEYYCDICGITDDPKDVNLRHCESCNVCMPGLTFHCEMCKACFALPVADHFSAVHGQPVTQNGANSHSLYQM